MKRRRPTPARAAQWGRWFEDTREPMADGSRRFGNGLFTVHARPLNPDLGMAGAVHLSIHDQRRSTRHDWREFQRIKSELMGPEREAVELYPAESRVIDTSNEYHLWVFPEGDQVPMGFETGRHVLGPDDQIDDDTLNAAADQMGLDPDLVRRNLRKVRQRKVAS